MMKNRLTEGYKCSRKVKISVTDDMLEWLNDEQVIRINFDDCSATIRFDDVYPYWKSEEKYQARMRNILSDTYVKVLDYEGQFTLEHSSLFLEEEGKIKIGKVFSATIASCDHYSAFCKLQQGNIVRVGRGEIPAAKVEDVRRIFIPGDKVELIINKCRSEKGIMKYWGSFFVPGREFTGREGQYVRVRVGEEDDSVKNGVFATILDCGEERVGILDYSEEVTSFIEGSVIIAKIKQISGKKIKLRIPEYLK